MFVEQPRASPGSAKYLGDMVGLNPPTGEPGVIGSRAELELELQTEVQWGCTVFSSFFVYISYGMLSRGLQYDDFFLVVKFPQEGMLPMAPQALLQPR